jgi:hypothetical protein
MNNSESFENDMNAFCELIKKWNGGIAQIDHYIVSHSVLRMHIKPRDDSFSILKIELGSCDFLSGPVRWESCKIEVYEKKNGRGYILIDVKHGFCVQCYDFSVEETKFSLPQTQIMLIEKEELPDWFSYPTEFLFIVEHGLVNINPWIILEGDVLRSWMKVLKDIYPEQDLIPFAVRRDSNILACWKKSTLYQIDIIDFNKKSHYDPIKSYSSVWSWFKSVVDEMIDLTSKEV